MRRRRPKAKINVPVASMGDIAFLLIIFFVLCSNFMKKAGVTINPPQAPNLEKLSAPRIYLAIDAEKNVHFQGRKIGSAEDAAQLAKEIEAEVAALVDPNASPEERTVIFECDESVEKEDFEPFLDAIAKGGGVIGAVGRKQGASGQ